MSKKEAPASGPMDFRKDELIGIFISIVVAVAFFAALRFDITGKLFGPKAEVATTSPEVVIIDRSQSMNELMKSLQDAISRNGVAKKLIMEDTKVGEGKEVVKGSRVSVNYIGMLRDGTKFDDSYSRGATFEFVVGAGRVIRGWDEGVLGMREGGERILVIPPDMAYGDREVGPIPANSELLFAVEVVKVQ